MKRLQPYILIAAGLASVIVLFVVFVLGTTVSHPASDIALAKDRIPLDTPSSGPAAFLPDHTFRLDTSFPNTSLDSLPELIDKLVAGPEIATKADQANLRNIVSQLNDGEDVIGGVYVPGVFALPISQQPANNPIFVSNKRDRLTQFRSAARNGVTGLLAHNYLAGSLFYDLVPGHKVMIISGDGAIHHYRVTSLHRYQNLNPSDLRSNLVDLSSGQELPAADVFQRFYRGEHQVTFQTCLERDGRLDWGFLFVVAEPIEILEYNQR